MTDLRTELATLIASRICHDLISPIGAISNGLELVALGGGLSDGPELQLINESCDNANARIRFFRVAYGAANTTANVSASEVKSILSALTQGTRLEVHWDTQDDLPRADVQLAFLALQCLESALKRGGAVHIRPKGNEIKVTAQSPHLACDPELWHLLRAPTTTRSILGSASGVAPAHVQFILLPLLAADQGRVLGVVQRDDEVVMYL